MDLALAVLRHVGAVGLVGAAAEGRFGQLLCMVKKQLNGCIVGRWGFWISLWLA